MTQCTRCGSHPDDWMDENGMPLDPPIFEAVISVCEGCAALDHANDSMSEKIRGAYSRLGPFGTASDDDEREEDADP